MENIEELKSRLSEVEEKLSEYNNLIIENDPESLTEEFDQEYRRLQEEYALLKETLRVSKTDKADSFFNKVSMGLFFYFVVMFLLVFPLTIYLIGNETTLATLLKVSESIENGTSYTTLQIQTLVILGFLVYPFALTIINTLVGLIFARSKENKKVFFIWNIVFAVLLISGIIWGTIEFILPVFK